MRALRGSDDDARHILQGSPESSTDPPDLPPPSAARSGSQGRAAPDPAGVDGRERCATIAAGRGQPMPMSKPWLISRLRCIERSCC